ncbi:hypothetical protein [Marinicella meishanensis]|uniref:hypothetical protein n=1 Tax=Marinicella meishanensis TaxID=2873263 RepID=UPI001CBDED6F|nr:hypothetical protein [Marinicella sp. NBU2979]
MIFDTGTKLKLHYNFINQETGEFVNVIFVTDKKSQQYSEMVITTKDGQLITNDGIEHFFSHSLYGDEKSNVSKSGLIAQFFNNMPLESMNNALDDAGVFNKGYSDSECTLLANSISFHMQQYFVAKRMGNDDAAETHRIEVGFLMHEHSQNC